MSYLKKLLAGALGVAALAVGGAAIADAAASHSRSATTTTAGSPPPAMPAFPAHGTAAHEDAEKPVTGAAADTAKAAALKEVGSGTAGDVTTDYPGTGYEVTVTKPDGSAVEVHLDGSFSVLQRPGGPPPSAPGWRPA